MRIIAGRFKGFEVKAPKQGTRPTTDRVKEAIFSHLESQGALYDGASVLDLFAGTGALGIEALSRGASHLTLVDNAPQAVALLTKAAAGLRHARAWRPDMSMRVMRAKAEAVATSAPTGGQACSVIFIDPPYAYADADFDALLTALAAGGWTDGDAIIVAERSSRSADPTPPEGWHIYHAKAYGETTIHYLAME